MGTPVAVTAGSDDQVETRSGRRRSARRTTRRFPFARRAARARRRQQGVLLGVVAGLVAFAALLPLMTGSIARTMVDNRVRDLGALGRTVEVRALPDGGTVPSTASLAPLLGPQWDGIASPVVQQQRITAVATVAGATGRVTLLGRAGFCDRVRVTAGRCATSRFEVMVPGAPGKTGGVVPGDRVVLVQDNGVNVPVRRTLLVTGLFTPREPAADYWSATTVPQGVAIPAGAEGRTVQPPTWLTPLASFTGTVPPPVDRNGPPPPADRESPRSLGWSNVQTTAFRQLIPLAFSYDKLDQARGAVERTRSLASAAQPPVDVTENVTFLDEGVRGDVEQVQVIAPLLLAQLVLLQVVLVWVVLRALLTQRRTEVALVRLRSPGARGARRLVLGELLPPVLVGLPVGLALAYALQALLRTIWVPGPAGWSWPALAAGAAAAAVCVVLLLVLVRGVVRTPISALLRTVPPRQRRWSLSAVETVLLTLAAGMLLAVATGNLSGAPVLVTPLVIALAVGLLVGGLLVPLGNRVAGRLLDRGRLPSLLALTGLARRPSTRQLILALTAAGALLAFGASTLVLGQANRAAATSAQTGAPVRLLAIDASATVDPQNLVRVVDQVDRQRQHLAPVFRVRSGSSDGPVALLGEPGPMTRIASKVNGIDPWARLGDASSGNASAGGAGLPAVVASWSAPATEGGFTAPSLRQADTEYVVAAQVPLVPGGEANTFVTPLAPQLRAADRRDLTAEIWSDGSDPALEQRAIAALRGAGYSGVTVERASTTQRRLDESASAYGLQLGLVVAAGSVVVAVLVLVAVLSSQAAGRRRERAALERAGVSRAVLGRAGRLETGLTVAPLLLGGAVGWLGARLAAPSIPWFTQPPPFPVAQETPPVLPAVLAVGAGLVVVAGVALVAGRGKESA